MPDSNLPVTQRDAARLEAAIRDLTESMNGLASKIEATYVRKDVLEPQIESIVNAIKAHSSYWTWLVRLVVGAVIIGLIGLLIASGGSSGPTG